jgi:hypothetical protein
MKGSIYLFGIPFANATVLDFLGTSDDTTIATVDIAN